MKRAFAIFIASMLMFLPTLGFAGANPEVYASMPKLQIDSPTQNISYKTSNVSFAVTAQVRQDQLLNQTYPYFSCTLDGFNFNVNATYSGETLDGWTMFKGKIECELANGQHNVSVNQISNSQTAAMLNALVSFTIANPNGISLPTPAAPEFSVNFEGSKPAKYTQLSWELSSLPYATFTIKNQEFPAEMQSGQKIDLYYYFRWKPHADSSWYSYTTPVAANRSSETTFSSLMLLHGESPSDPHVSGLVDFQVAARAVSITEDSIYVGQTSDWSSTQTIATTASSTSPSPTPTIPELSWLVILPLLVIIPFIAVKLRQRKTSRPT